MPQNPRTPAQQTPIIRSRLEQMAAPGGPLAGAEVSPQELSRDTLLESIDSTEPWPVNLKTIALDLVPDLDRGDVEVSE